MSRTPTTLRLTLLAAFTVGVVAIPPRVSASPLQQATPPAQTAADPKSTVPAQQSAPSPPPQQSRTPLGTAAAPLAQVDGVPASTPSGAAIAPGKQKRVRKFSIRTALVIGAVVAIGTVTGATLATSSHP
jgi:hypothetical protein